MSIVTFIKNLLFKVSYYLSKVERESLFFQVSLGYVRYRDNTRIEQANGFGENGDSGFYFGVTKFSYNINIIM